MTYSSKLKNINYPKRTAAILLLLIAFTLTTSYWLATLLFFVISFIFATIILNQAYKIHSEQQNEQRKITVAAQAEEMKENAIQLTQESPKPQSNDYRLSNNSQLLAWDNIVKQGEQKLNQTRLAPTSAANPNKVSFITRKA